MPDASQSIAEDAAHDLANELMSPYCPGRTVANCPSPQARALEQYMITQLQSGSSREQLEAELVARYPDIQGTRSRPELLYGILLVGVLALLGIALLARRWLNKSKSAAKPEEPTTNEQISPQELARLHDALDRVEEF